MAATESTMLALNTPAPKFNLPDPVSGSNVSLDEYSGQPILIAFICNHCPYVIHILNSFTAFSSEYKEKGLVTIAISANDVANYPDDGPELMVKLAQQYNFSFPYLYDESQAVAHEYTAACTPDFFLFDSTGKLFYRGQYDASRPKNTEPVTGNSLRSAVDSLLAGDTTYGGVQNASMGCNIKWKPGNEPDYF